MSPRAYTKFFALLTLLFAPAVCAQAQEGCLSYEPAEVQLSGTISKQVVPGPPNYQSVRRGDKPETIWVLTLDKPLCVTGNTDDVNEPEENVTNLQLLLQQNHFAQLRRMAGRRVRVAASGKLFHAHTAHHRTKVLLDVKEIRQEAGVRSQKSE